MECHARKNFLADINAHKFVMMVDVLIVELLFSSTVDAERLNEKFNATRLNNQKINFIAIQYVKRKGVAEFTYVILNVVNLKI